MPLRVLGADGRSRAYVNDQPTGVTAVREIGAALVEVHDDAGALAPGDYVRVCVADTGSGMAPDIAARAFERRFQLADFVEVKGAELANGLLHIELKRNIPDEMKPRKIEIAKGNGASTPQIEAKAQN